MGAVVSRKAGEDGDFDTCELYQSVSEQCLLKYGSRRRIGRLLLEGRGSLLQN